jgi:hypothetical protein
MAIVKEKNSADIMLQCMEAARKDAISRLSTVQHWFLITCGWTEENNLWTSPESHISRHTGIGMYAAIGSQKLCFLKQEEVYNSLQYAQKMLDDFEKVILQLDEDVRQCMVHFLLFCGWEHKTTYWVPPGGVDENGFPAEYEKLSCAVDIQRKWLENK